jgi:glucan-binding YG repeat protein
MAFDYYGTSLFQYKIGSVSIMANHINNLGIKSSIIIPLVLLGMGNNSVQAIEDNSEAIKSAFSPSSDIVSAFEPFHVNLDPNVNPSTEAIKLNLSSQNPSEKLMADLTIIQEPELIAENPSLKLHNLNYIWVDELPADQSISPEISLVNLTNEQQSNFVSSMEQLKANLPSKINLETKAVSVNQNPEITAENSPAPIAENTSDNSNYVWFEDLSDHEIANAVSSPSIILNKNKNKNKHQTDNQNQIQWNDLHLSNSAAQFGAETIAAVPETLINSPVSSSNRISQQTTPAPAPTPQRTTPAPAPAPTPQQTTPAPAPTPQQTTPAPAPTPQQTTPAPAPTPQPNVMPSTEVVWVSSRFDYYSSSSNLEKFVFEPTVRTRLADRSFLDVRTGINTFSQPREQEVFNVPLNITWHKNITPELRFNIGGGLDFFGNSPTALNFNTGLNYRVPLMRNEETNRLESFLDIGMAIDQSPYKVTARALNNNITNWDIRPLRVLWQINPNTRFNTELGLNLYNDDNSSFRTSTQLRHKIAGIFEVGAAVSTDSFDQNSRAYSTPSSVLSYGAILGVEGKLADPLTCKLAAYLGQRTVDNRDFSQQRYRVGCDLSVNSNLDLSIGYEYSENSRDDTDFISDSDRFMGRFFYRF